MLVAAAVCPCPPLLVPEVAAGAAAELAEVRAACRQALDALAAVRPERLVVAGTAAGAGGEVRHPAGSRGSFAEFRVALTVTLGEAGPGGGGPPLPPSLAVAAWLLADAGWRAAPVEGRALGEELPPEECLAAGRRLAAGPRRTALLAMGDGSACRSRTAPGYLDPRAEDFDAAVARALAAADPGALAAVDTGLAAELGAAGRPVWQLLAGAAEGAALRGRLHYDGAPYGVAYHVADWTPA